MDALPLQNAAHKSSTPRSPRSRSVAAMHPHPERDAPNVVHPRLGSELAYRQTIDLIHNVLERDGVVMVPSIGGYALAALPTSDRALAYLRTAWSRNEATVPLAAASVVMAAGLVHLDDTSARVIEQMWPGPLALTVRIRARKARAVSRMLHVSEGAVAIYVTSAAIERTIAAEAGTPLAIAMIRDAAGRTVQDYVQAVDLVWKKVDELVAHHRVPWAAVRTQVPFVGTEGPTLVRLETNGRLQVVVEGAVAITEITPLLHRVAISEGMWG